jgi:cell division protein FtsW (lipid II flippase)
VLSIAYLKVNVNGLTELLFFAWYTSSMKSNSQPQPNIKRSWKQQFFGVFAGIGAGLIIMSVFPDFAESVGRPRLMLFCAALGGILLSISGYEQAGKVLTRSDKRWLNIMVGLGLPLLVIAVVGVLLVWLGPDR